MLSASLGTSEHPGRLRGHSVYVNISDVYGRGPRKSVHRNCMTREEAERMWKIQEEQLESKFAAREQEFQTKLTSQMQSYFEKMGYGPASIVVDSPKSRPPTQVAQISCQNNLFTTFK